MTIKKILGVMALVLMVSAFCLSPAQADEWYIIGTVTQAGISNGNVWVVVSDAGSNPWGALVEATREKEILATALTAASANTTVVGLYDTVNHLWLDLYLKLD